MKLPGSGAFVACMRIAALTMVYRDHWALSRWVAHHGAQLGPENLFIVAHGPDPEIARIAPDSSVLTVPREGFDNFDKARAEMLDGFHAGLSKVYDWVIRTDADELICFDPARYDGLPQVFATHGDTPVLTALGFDVAETDADDPISPGPVFAQRKQIAFSGHYSKAVASRRPIAFRLHGVQVAPRRLEGFPFKMPEGLYLAHLKYANRAVLDAGNAVRMAVANGPGIGLPGAGWQAADDDAQTFYAQFAQKSWRGWDEAAEDAYRALSVKPARVERFNVVKTRALKLTRRTTLPDRFALQG